MDRNEEIQRTYIRKFENGKPRSKEYARGKKNAVACIPGKRILISCERRGLRVRDTGIFMKIGNGNNIKSLD